MFVYDSDDVADWIELDLEDNSDFLSFTSLVFPSRSGALCESTLKLTVYWLDSDLIPRLLENIFHWLTLARSGATDGPFTNVVNAK